MSSSFVTELILRPLPDGRHFELMEEFDYSIGALGSGRWVRVPKGFKTDFASIPRVFWNILPPWGVYGKPCVLHDYLYNGGVITEATGVEGVERHVDPTREQADNILRDGMEVLGVGWWTRHIIFRGVRVGGACIWSKEHHPHEAR